MFLPGIWRSRLEEEVLANRNDGRPQSVMSYSICRRQHKMEHTGHGCHFTCLGAPCNTDKDEGKRMAGFLKQQILKTESLERNYFPPEKEPSVGHTSHRSPVWGCPATVKVISTPVSCGA
ncbi:uncharacterized protein LOC144314529 isoform X3 [Canis aureus]